MESVDSEIDTKQTANKMVLKHFFLFLINLLKHRTRLFWFN